jgi:hypothetical protein
MRALGLCLLAGTCAVSMILATPTPATSQPSDLSLGLGQFGAAAVEEVRHRPYRTPTVAITGPTIDRITTPTTATMVGPTIIGPTTTIQGGAEASMQLNSCCNASLPNPS